MSIRRSIRRRTFLAAGTIALPLAAAGVTAPAARAAAARPVGNLTNLAHLDWLGAAITPPEQPGHTTYRLTDEPHIGVLWTYADRRPDGTYQRIGGGAYDPATDTYGQGAFNADDISRAAVAYVRHWQATGAASSRTAACHLLRGLTFLQTTTGHGAGNVVLWMQPDGTLNPSAEPKESPDPSDSSDSYWLARTIWALGEGHAAFARTDRRFARFLGDRLQLALDAVDRHVLSRYGEWLDIDGTGVPAWLIADGADATGEALLGLTAYVRASDDPRARGVLAKLSEGVAAMRAGTPRTWPFGAVLPWALSRAVWHGWGGLAPAGLARSYDVLGDKRLLDAALTDVASFTPHLLIAAGPQNGWMPTPSDPAQIAYGAQSRVESLLVAADAGDRPRLRALAGVAASWFFGNNPAGTPMYDPATGRTFDGVDGGGKVNQNSGAESTIHGLLAMLALDGAPDTAAVARTATVVERTGWRLIEAETGTLSGDAGPHHPGSAWTGESQWSGGAGVRLGPGGRLVLDVPVIEPSVLMPAVELAPNAGTSEWRVDARAVGLVDHGEVGAQGDSPARGLLAVRTLPRTVRRSGTVTVTGVRGTTVVDALLVQPEVERLVLDGRGHGTALLRSFGTGPRQAAVRVPGVGAATAWVFDETGRTVRVTTATGPVVKVTLPAGGSALIRR
ncbi:hypothetical protein [Actinomadura sp. HBU206391]|uniref:hypothetical protein n=1 Tax=Actinomadura sp. HBU206391 TaxID=2731692 RepID=UPI00164F28AF|nr:hypothetical protein [Actinomadura sp. HBU206391]MBC6460183.1 hypothetical protein [Actinomadura sp. HBU206391]